MTELKDNQRELSQFRLRLTVLGALVFVCFGALLARFIWLQVYKHSDYVAQAEENRIAIVPIEPNRGLILDRNGVVLADNRPSFNLTITRERAANVKEELDEVVSLLHLPAEDRTLFDKAMKQARGACTSAQPGTGEGVRIEARWVKTWQLHRQGLIHESRPRRGTHDQFNPRCCAKLHST